MVINIKIFKSQLLFFKVTSNKLAVSALIQSRNISITPLTHLWQQLIIVRHDYLNIYLFQRLGKTIKNELKYQSFAKQSGAARRLQADW